MIVHFLLIILINNVITISGDDSDDTKYIETLPPSVKKTLLDRVARRILNEVPEVSSGDTDINGDILAGKLEEQSEFVKRIMKQEVESLKNKRKRFQKLKKFRKVGDTNDQLSGTPDLDKNEMKVDKIDAKKSENVKMDSDFGHIDLTVRSGRSKRGDSGVNNESSPKDSLNVHRSPTGGFIPVEIKPDDKNDDKEPTNNNIGNTTEVSKVINHSDEDIQIRNVGENKKSEMKDKKKRNVVTKDPANAGKSTTQINLDSEHVPLKMFIGRRSDDLDLNKKDEVESSTTGDASTISVSLNTNSNDVQTSEDYITTPDIIDTTVADVKVNSSEITEYTKKSNSNASKYSSESYLENPIVENKGRKNLDNSDETTKQTEEESLVKSEPVLNDSNLTFTEDPKIVYTETSYLTTLEASYETTTALNQRLTNKSIETNIEANTDHKKALMNLKTTESEEDSKLDIPENKSLNNETTNVKVSNNSTIEANETKINAKKPCNETSYKVGVVKDCDKKLNKTTIETPNVAETKIIDNEPKVKTTINTSEPEPKESLRSGKNKPQYDSLIHFGDMQIKKEYEVYELDSGKPAFVKQNEKDNYEKSSLEQPQYAPVYNYDPKNAYFNAYNRLGPNEDESDDGNDRDDESGSSEPENDKSFRSKRKRSKLRMSKIVKDDEGKSHKTTDASDELDKTTKPYFSKEAICDYKVSEEKKEDEEIIDVESLEFDNTANGVRQTYYNHKIFGYVPTNKERKDRLSEKAKYLYNNILGKSTEEILDENKYKVKQFLRVNDDDRYEDKDDASEDIKDENANDVKKNARKSAEDDKKFEVVVIDMDKNPSLPLRQGGYFSSKYKWDEEGNSFRNEGKVYDLSHIVPYSTEKSIILNQRGESNKIFNIIKNFVKQDKENNSAEIVKIDPEDIKKTVDSLKNMDMSKTLFNQSHIDQMVEGVENFVKPPPPNVPIPSVPPRYFQYLKQKLANLRQQNDIHNILRSNNCSKVAKCVKNKQTEKPKYKAPNEVLNSIKKITDITPEVDMYQNIAPMLNINGLSIARSRDDDLELYVRILKDMVKMDNKALEEYDWLATTVAVQSSLAKLKEIIGQLKNRQDVHPADLNLYKYAEELHTKAREVTKEKEGETIDEYLEELKYDKIGNNNERMALPKTHRKIKNPLKILMQITDLMNKKVLRNDIGNKTKNFEMFLDCIQQCLDDFHTAIREITRITKYNKQRWYKNVKELYLAAGGEKEYLEVLLHLYSMKLFGLIEDSAQNGAERDYRGYMKKNRFEVDRAQAEMMFIMRILKAIHDLK